MAAHKVNRWQLQLPRTLHAILGAEKPCLSFDLNDLILHLLNVLHVFVNLPLAFLNHLILLL